MDFEQLLSESLVCPTVMKDGTNRTAGLVVQNNAKQSRI